jgi:DNA-binding response OmpR family regulator
LRVLVIEDEPDVMSLLVRHLRRLGCTVEEASTGLEGLRVARDNPPDVVVVDILLPDIDGNEVVRRLRAPGPTEACRVVTTSILDPSEYPEIGDQVLNKPFDRNSVERMLAALSREASS